LLFGSYAQFLLQVQVNLAKDVLKKVETNLEQHKEYSENYEKAKVWIENAKQVIWDCSEASSNSSREVLQARLEQIQVSLKYFIVPNYSFTKKFCSICPVNVPLVIKNLFLVLVIMKFLSWVKCS